MVRSTSDQKKEKTLLFDSMKQGAGGKFAWHISGRDQDLNIL